MRPQVVVIVLPQLALFAHLAQAAEEVGVEQLAAKRAVKCPHISNRIKKNVIPSLPRNLARVSRRRE